MSSERPGSGCPGAFDPPEHGFEFAVEADEQVPGVLACPGDGIGLIMGVFEVVVADEELIQEFADGGLDDAGIGLGEGGLKRGDGPAHGRVKLGREPH